MNKKRNTELKSMTIIMLLLAGFAVVFVTNNSFVEKAKATSSYTNLDYTSFTEYDPGGYITVANSTHIDAVNLPSNVDAYVYKDYGVNGIVGNFEYQMEVKWNSETGHYAAMSFWCVSDTLDDICEMMYTQNNKTISLFCWAGESSQHLMVLASNDGVVQDQDQYTPSLGTWYYLTVGRNATNIYAKIYSDKNRLTLLDTLSVNYVYDSYRYLYALDSWNNAVSNYGDWDIQNLRILNVGIPAFPNCGGTIYASGSSISDGSTKHDTIHYGASDCISNQYQYWFDYYMNIYGVQTNLSDWYHNQSYASSWDKYSIGTGGGQTNPDNDGCYGAGGGDTGEYPYCCHCPPTNVGQAEDAMYMACIPAQIDGVYGRALWRYENLDWSTVKYFVVEAGVNEAMDHGYGVNYRGSVWTGMNGIYNRSLTYGFKMVLLKSIPYDSATYGQSYLDAVNQEKDKFAALHPDVIYVDTFNTSMCHWTTPYTAWTYNSAYYNDTAHPNQAGYRLIGQIVAHALYEDMLTNEALFFISIDGGVNGTYTNNSNPTFKWSKIDTAVQYQLQIATDSNFASLVVDIQNINTYEYPLYCAINATQVTFTLPNIYSLPKNTYYCRVRAMT